jgi:hypothetical protein
MVQAALGFKSDTLAGEEAHPSIAREPASFVEKKMGGSSPAHTRPQGCRLSNVSQHFGLPVEWYPIECADFRLTTTTSSSRFGKCS